MIEIPSPPKLSELRYGTQLVSGLGVSTVVADFDFETYSPAGFVWNEDKQKFVPPRGASKKGLSAVGTAAYTEHPDAEVLSLAYNLKDGRGPQLWIPDCARYSLHALASRLSYHIIPGGAYSLPEDLFEHINEGGLLEAWNVGFERWVWENICVPKYGFPPLPVSVLRCAMAKSRAFSLPGSLDKSGEVLSIAHKKDKRGKKILDTFSIPRNPTPKDRRKRINPPNERIAAQELYDYNLRDIEAEAEISSLIPDLDEFELTFWQIDQRINQRGVTIDIEAVDACIKIIEELYEKYNKELTELTDGNVTSVTQTAKILKWFLIRNYPLPSLDSDTVEQSLDALRIQLSSLSQKKDWLDSMNSSNLELDCKDKIRVLEIRKLLNSASVKKLYSLKNRVTKYNKVHDLFVYHSARTGRAAGNGPQPQNLPNSGPTVFKTEWSASQANYFLNLIKNGDTLALYEEPIKIISGCLRGLFIASPGHDFICSDYSAIEAVVLAELAGETWRQEVFRTHGKIYEMSASKIFGVPFDVIINHKHEMGQHHELRKKGKVAELASGYQGWVGAWKQFGADKFFSTEQELKEAILAWRAASPAIVEYWGGYRHGTYYGVEGAAIHAVLSPGIRFQNRSISFICQRDILYCTLPSGRNLTYHRPELANSERKMGALSLSYEGYNTNPKNGKIGWSRMDTYGGKLVENITQAVARDILANAIVNLEKNKYPVVLHVHDEIVSEVPESFGSIENFENIMNTLPSWAINWPIKATEGWRAKRYSK